MTKTKSEKSKITNKLFLLSLSIFLIDFSILYLNDFGKILLNQVMLSSLAVSFVFGFFHGLKIYRIEKYIEGKNSLLSLLYLSCVFTAWYNVILLPVSGFGAMEWILFSVIIFSDFLISASGKSKESNLASSISYISSSNSNLMIFGSLMFIVKSVIFNLLPDNLYVSSFVGNQTARNFVLLFCVIGLICLLSFLIKFAKSKVSVSQKQKSAVLGFFKIIGKSILNFFSLIFTAISGPILIVIIFCVIFIAGIVIFAEAGAICDDILKFVEPVLIKLTSTGKAAIIQSSFYFVIQFLVFAAVLVFSFTYKNHLEDCAKRKIELEIYDEIKNQEIPDEQKDKIFKEKIAELKNQKNSIALLCNSEKLKLIENISEEK